MNWLNAVLYIFRDKGGRQPSQIFFKNFQIVFNERNVFIIYIHRYNIIKITNIFAKTTRVASTVYMIYNVLEFDMY
jgi:hypothetical protein